MIFNGIVAQASNYENRCYCRKVFVDLNSQVCYVAKSSNGFKLSEEPFYKPVYNIRINRKCTQGRRNNKTLPGLKINKNEIKVKKNSN